MSFIQSDAQSLQGDNIMWKGYFERGKGNSFIICLVSNLRPVARWKGHIDSLKNLFFLWRSSCVIELTKPDWPVFRENFSACIIWLSILSHETVSSYNKANKIPWPLRKCKMMWLTYVETEVQKMSCTVTLSSDWMNNERYIRIEPFHRNEDYKWPLVSNNLWHGCVSWSLKYHNSSFYLVLLWKKKQRCFSKASSKNYTQSWCYE